MTDMHVLAVEFMRRISPQLKGIVNDLFLDENGSTSKTNFAYDARQGIHSWVDSIVKPSYFVDLNRPEKVESRLRKINRVLGHIIVNKYTNPDTIALLSEIKDEADSYLVMIQMSNTG